MGVAQVVTKFLRAPALVIIVLVFLSNCATATGVVPTSTQTPASHTTTAPSATPKNNKGENDARTLLVDSVRALGQTNSYHFSVVAALRTTFEGKPREWTFSGVGAAAKQGKVQWTLEGQADVFFEVVSADGQIYCSDSRGENKDCSLAFGGPRPGASPYTVISYLQNFDEVGEMTTKSIQGKEYFHVPFSPSLQRVAALDASHAKALANVASVNGEVWIDRNTKLPHMEKAVVTYRPTATGEDSVEMAVTFEKYNQAVDIKLPR